MLSLNLSPWGTLAVSTIISSNLTGIQYSCYRQRNCLSQFLYFSFNWTNISLEVINGISLFKEKWHLAITHGFLFFLLLVFNHFKLTEIAGVLAGICTSIITFLFYYNFSPYKNAINKIILNLLRTLFHIFITYVYFNIKNT